MGSRTSSRPRRPESTTDGRSTAHLTFRPRRFSRPRRFAPSILSWACFIPLPRPGFASGVSSRHPVRADSSPSRSSPPLVSSSCLRFRAGAGSRHVDLEGSILVGDPQSPAGRLIQQLIRVPSCVLRSFGPHCPRPWSVHRDLRPQPSRHRTTCPRRRRLPAFRSVPDVRISVPRLPFPFELLGLRTPACAGPREAHHRAVIATA